MEEITISPVHGAWWQDLEIQAACQHQQCGLEESPLI
jgi:hypothetical protein